VTVNTPSQADPHAATPAGQPVSDDDPMAEHFGAPPGSGSVIAVVATDAPLLPGQCKAFARRVTPGLARHRHRGLALLR
jgi:L-aminopeptidase/D-esterase-like protein